MKNTKAFYRQTKLGCCRSHFCHFLGFTHFLLTAWHIWKESSTVVIVSIVAKIVSSIATNTKYTIETISDSSSSSISPHPEEK